MLTVFVTIHYIFDWTFGQLDNCCQFLFMFRENGRLGMADGRRIYCRHTADICGGYMADIRLLDLRVYGGHKADIRHFDVSLS